MQTLTLRIENEETLTQGVDIARQFTLGPSDASIGRKPGNDWVLPDETRHISGRHFTIRHHNSNFILNDLSTNGTFLMSAAGGKERVSGNHLVQHGDRFTVGAYVLVASLAAQSAAVAAPVEPAPVPAPEIAPAPAPTPPPAPEIPQSPAAPVVDDLPPAPLDTGAIPPAPAPLIPDDAIDMFDNLLGDEPLAPPEDTPADILTQSSGVALPPHARGVQSAPTLNVTGSSGVSRPPSHHSPAPRPSSNEGTSSPQAPDFAEFARRAEERGQTGLVRPPFGGSAANKDASAVSSEKAPAAIPIAEDIPPLAPAAPEAIPAEAGLSDAIIPVPEATPETPPSQAAPPLQEVEAPSRSPSWSPSPPAPDAQHPAVEDPFGAALAANIPEDDDFLSDLAPPADVETPPVPQPAPVPAPPPAVPSAAPQDPFRASPTSVGESFSETGVDPQKLTPSKPVVPLRPATPPPVAPPAPPPAAPPPAAPPPAAPPPAAPHPVAPLAVMPLVAKAVEAGANAAPADGGFSDSDAAQPAVPSPAAPQPDPVQKTSDDSAFLRGFLDGAGLAGDSEMKVSPEELGRMAGEALRVSVEASMGMLHDRAAAKYEASDEDRTMITSSGNNPMKFTTDPEEALRQLFLQPREGYLTGADGFDNALSDIRRHQVAMVAAIQPAFDEVLNGLSPEDIENDTEGGGKLLGKGSKRQWEEFARRWHERTEGFQDASNEVQAMQDAYIAAFSRHYSAALRKL